MAGTERIRRGQVPQTLERGVEIAPQLERVEALVQRLELGVGRGGQHAGGAQALVGGLGTIEDAVQARAVTMLAHELLHRLEEIDVQAREAIDASELGIGALETKRS